MAERPIIQQKTKLKLVHWVDPLEPGLSIHSAVQKMWDLNSYPLQYTLGRSNATLLHRPQSTHMNEQSTQDLLQNIAHCNWRLMYYTVTNNHLITNCCNLSTSTRWTTHLLLLPWYSWAFTWITVFLFKRFL